MASRKRKRRPVAKRAKRYTVMCFDGSTATAVARLPLAQAKSVAAQLCAKHKSKVYEVVA